MLPTRFPCAVQASQMLLGLPDQQRQWLAFFCTISRSLLPVSMRTNPILPLTMGVTRSSLSLDSLSTYESRTLRARAAYGTWIERNLSHLSKIAFETTTTSQCHLHDLSKEILSTFMVSAGAKRTKALADASTPQRRAKQV